METSYNFFHDIDLISSEHYTQTYLKYKYNKYLINHSNNIIIYQNAKENFVPVHSFFFIQCNGISKSIYILNIEPHLIPRVVSVVVQNQNNIRMIQQDLLS